MDLKHFKKVHEAEDHSVLRHPDGHEIKILHGKLKKPEIGQLKALPMADGGEVPDEEQQVAASNMAPSAPTQQAAPPMADYSKELKDAVGRQQQGLTEEAKAGQQEARALSQKVTTPEGEEHTGAIPEAVRDQSADYQQGKTQVQDLLQQRQHVINDIQNGHINPNQFLENQSVGSKIATAIGLIASGMGSAVTGQRNAAQDWLNGQIERNVQGQAMEMNKKQNVLTALSQQLGSTRDAMDMARVHNADILSLKMQQAGAEAKDPMAKARLDQAAGQLQAQYAPVFAQLQYRTQLLQGIRSGALPAEMAVPGLVPQEHQKDVLHELGQAQNANQMEDKILDAFDRSDKQNTVLKTGAGLREPPAIKEFNVLTYPLLHDALGRVNEVELKHVSSLAPQPGDLPGTVQGKRQALKNWVREKQSAPTAQAFGIPVPKRTGNFTPRENQLARPGQ